MLVWKQILWLRERIIEQRKWIERCGGSLDGYIRNYGDPKVPPIVNGNRKVIVLNREQRNLFSGERLTRANMEDWPADVPNGSEAWYAPHSGDGGTAIWNADFATLQKWCRELGEILTNCFGAYQRARDEKQDIDDVLHDAWEFIAVNT